MLKRVAVSCISIMCFTQQALGIFSVVYNLRIAETTRHQEFERKLMRPSIAAATTFAQFRKRHSGQKERYIGELGSLIYLPSSCYVKADFAFANAHLNDDGVTSSRTQTDDILFTAGYSPTISQRVKLTFSGLLGVPTHRDQSLQNVQVGVAHIALGTQIDSAFNYSKNHKQTFMAAVRFIHFFPRTVSVILGQQCSDFNFSIGNLTDLFFAHHSIFGKHGMHRIEVGYNPAFLTNANIRPMLDEVIQQTDFIRNSFYGTYKYNFLIHKLHSALTVALSYGFDSKPKLFGNKQIITAWATWGINF